MNRDQMLAILSSMSDDALMKACAANGIECGGAGYDLGDQGSADGLESWNDTRIDMPQHKSPPLVDHSKITEMRKQMTAKPQPQIRDMLGPEATGLEDMTPPEATGVY